MYFQLRQVSIVFGMLENGKWLSSDLLDIHLFAFVDCYIVVEYHPPQ